MVRKPGASRRDADGALAKRGSTTYSSSAATQTPPEGPYRLGIELLPLVVEHPQRPTTIGIAGYPEGHPLIDDDNARAGAPRKEPRGGLHRDAALLRPETSSLRWVRSIREQGIDLPVHVSVPGMVDRRRLLEISARVGVGPSLSYLRKQGGIRNLFRLSKSSADRLVDALAPHVGDPELNIAGFHYVTFNRLLETWRWEREKHPTTNSIGSLVQTEVTPR